MKERNEKLKITLPDGVPPEVVKWGKVNLQSLLKKIN